MVPYLFFKFLHFQQIRERERSTIVVYNTLTGAVFRMQAGALGNYFVNRLVKFEMCLLTLVKMRGFALINLTSSKSTFYFVRLICRFFDRSHFPKRLYYPDFFTPCPANAVLEKFNKQGTIYFDIASSSMLQLVVMYFHFTSTFKMASRGLKLDSNFFSPWTIRLFHCLL